MYRRVIILLLTPTLLLTQWVSVRQCHGCSQELGHELTPHIHLTAWPFATADSPHSSPCQGHPHDGASDPDNGHEGDSALVQCREHSPDHQGEGVVYLPTGFLHGWLSASHANEGGQILSLALPDCLTIPLPLFPSAHTPQFYLTAPDHVARLRTLPLLI